MANNFIPVNTPRFVGNERKYLIECIEQGWISSEGTFVKRFEEEFARFVGRKFGIAVSNGSAALDAAVVALNIGPGDEVIMPSFTIISCAAAVVRAGATPVVVDCDPNSWNMRVADIEAKITKRTKALMPVHIYGLPVDMDPLIQIAKKYNLKIIEDAAQAHGLTYKGKTCGSFGDLSTFSFYPNKHITTGEGGMIVTDDPEIAARCRSLRNLCFNEKQRFVHEEIGWNLRMTNLQAAVGLGQLEGIQSALETKRCNGRFYQESFQSLQDYVQLPLISLPYAENLYWVFGLVLKPNVSFDAHAARERLEKLGIGTRPFFFPMHQQPVFKKMNLFQDTALPQSEKLYERGFYIPSGLGLSLEQMKVVVTAVKSLFIGETA